jgi:membrane protease YdiL (CAAX protease family)
VAVLFSLFTPVVAGIFVAPLIIFYLLASGGDFSSLQEDSVVAALILLLGFAPVFFIIWGWLWLFENRHLWTIGMERAQFLRKYLRGLLIGLLMFGAAVAILAAFGAVAPESTGAGSLGPAALGASILLILGWIVQGAAEEALLRGFLLPVIGIRFGVTAGIVVSSLVFAALHLLNPNLSLISLLNLALFGVFAALFALYEGGLWGVYAIHSAWNWAQGNLFGFEVSGTQAGSTVLFDLMEVGPDWLTGGAFGPEGGLAVTAVLIAGSLLVWLANRQRAARGG